MFILKKIGYKKVKNWKNFFRATKCVIQFSKVVNLNSVRKNLNIRIQTKKQDKTLDLIIKNNEKIFLCEAKHLNTSGGGQDKQISELIEIINLKEKNKNVSYIAFLDGNYSNILLHDKAAGGKLSTQREEINKFLLCNPRSYWLNTIGFKSLFIDSK